MNTGKKSRRNIDFETPAVETEETEEESEGPKFLRDMENGLGQVFQGYFRIKVTKEEKGKTVNIYKNDKEPFEYPRVNSLVSALRYISINSAEKKDSFTDAEIDAFGESIPEAAGPAVLRLTKVFNDRLRADAKASQYQKLQQQYKPLEGEEKDVAVAKIIKQLLRVAPHLSAEVAIDILKGQKAVPEDYTVDDYVSTKLRKTKGEEVEEVEDDE